MEKTKDTIWFKGSNDLQTDLSNVENALHDIGPYFVGVIRLFPGMTDVKLVDQGKDFVTIQTNEGLMKRTRISITNIHDTISLEFDEEYQAAKTITTNSHFQHEFKMRERLVHHSLAIRLLKAPGFLGFFYRHFGSKNIGNAFLKAHKQVLEKC